MNISLFKKAALLYVLFFMGISNAWGFTSTASKSTLNNKFNSSEKSVSWDGNHVTFTLSGNNLYTTLGYLYIPHNATYTLSWSVEPGYDVTVKTVAVDVERASGTGYKMKVGNGAQSENLFWSWNIPEGGIKSGTLNYGNTQTVSIVVCKASTWSTCAVKSITVEYNLKPQINAANGSVEVTICDENKKKINLNTLAKPVVTNGHVSCSYSVESVTPAANTSATSASGHISGTDFYATQAGDYTIRISAASASCHQANSTTFTVTVTPATLSLTAPTASDITNHHTLSTSVLTGGSATIGSCEVAGTWAWKDPSTAPEMGDDQPFAVVFTPSANKGNYTNFETTALVDVKRAQYIFDGMGDGGDEEHVIWCKNDNWNENLKPGSEDEVIIEHNVVIRQEVSAYSVSIEEGVTLTIMPTGGLTVGAGGIIGANRDNLILKAGTEGDSKGKTGYLRISPEYTGAMPEATVELYSIGYYNRASEEENIAAWQYVGSPIVSNGVLAKTFFTKSWVYSYDESTDEWVNHLRNLEMTPFSGHATTQTRDAKGMLVTFQGQLLSNQGIETVDLAFTDDAHGHNILANSFMAPIDITEFEDEDFEGAEKIINIFNTGSRKDAETKNREVTAPGQYISIPVGTSREMKAAFGTPTFIAPMQGFCVRATSKNAKIKFDYEKLVWNSTPNNEPLHAPIRKQKTENTSDVNTLRVSLYSNGWGDHLYMLEADKYAAEYEDGYDAPKMVEGAFNIFALADDKQLAVNATDNIIGTRIGVRTGDSILYVMEFSHLNTEDDLALLDSETGETIDIYEGTEYTFFAEPNSVITERFQIVERANAPAVATGTENAKNGVKAQKFIKDGQLYVLKNGVLYNAMGAVVR